jgi:hypothetical protein
LFCHQRWDGMALMDVTVGVNYDHTVCVYSVSSQYKTVFVTPWIFMSIPFQLLPAQEEAGWPTSSETMQLLVLHIACTHARGRYLKPLPSRTFPIILYLAKIPPVRMPRPARLMWPVMIPGRNYPWSCAVLRSRSMACAVGTWPKHLPVSLHFVHT